jgi:hypothetical protein
MMSNVIDFLERMGQDAELRYGSCAKVAMALGSEDIEPALQELILAGDDAKLAEALGQGTMCCLLLPVKEGEESEEGGDGDDEMPQRDDEDIASSRNRLVMACVG